MRAGGDADHDKPAEDPVAAVTKFGFHAISGAIIVRDGIDSADAVEVGDKTRKISLEIFSRIMGNRNPNSVMSNADVGVMYEAFLEEAMRIVKERA